MPRKRPAVSTLAKKVRKILETGELRVEARHEFQRNKEEIVVTLAWFEGDEMAGVCDDSCFFMPDIAGLAEGLAEKVAGAVLRDVLPENWEDGDYDAMHAARADMLRFAARVCQLLVDNPEPSGLAEVRELVRQTEEKRAARKLEVEALAEEIGLSFVDAVNIARKLGDAKGLDVDYRRKAS